MRTIKCLVSYFLIVLAGLASGDAVAATSSGPRPIGAGSYPLTPVHASAWFAHRADSGGKHLTLMVYFEGTPGWHDNVTNFSWAVNSSPAHIDMLVGSTPVSIQYWPETMVVKILGQDFKLASNNVFLVSDIDKPNRKVRSLGVHDLTFDANDNPALVLVRRNPEIRASLVGEQLANKRGGVGKDTPPSDLVALTRQGLALIKKNDPKSDTMACDFFRQAAVRGYAESQYNLGYCYESGRGVAQDLAAANEWYLKAAQQGYVDAQYKLGHSYRVGRGVEIDLRTALMWYKKAAEAGDAEAQHNVGWMYATGQGVEVNVEMAFQWFLKAAESGDPAAQYEIARRYQAGDGVTRDMLSAYQWLLVLKSQKRSFAADDWKQVETLLNSVGKEISPEARVLAEGRTREWLQGYSKRYLERLKD